MSFLFVWQDLRPSSSLCRFRLHRLRAPTQAIFIRSRSGRPKNHFPAASLFFLVILLYRKITTIGSRISVLLWVWRRRHHALAHLGRHPPLRSKTSVRFSSRRVSFLLALVRRARRRHDQHGFTATGATTTSANLGWRNPRGPKKNIPRGIFLSILGITVLYLAMQTSLLGVVPWRESAETLPSSPSLFRRAPLWHRRRALRHLDGALDRHGLPFFSLLLGYSRVPYSARARRQFLPCLREKCTRRNIFPTFRF